MNGFESLAAGVGQWRGTNRLHDPHTGGPDDSPSTLTIAPMVGGKFLRLEYDWVYGGKPQQGALIIGQEADAGKVTAFWMDAWHMGDVALICHGVAEADDSLAVQGTYPAPPGPDWGWRIVLRAEPQTLRLLMVNIFPDGKEEAAVEAAYCR